ncbi:EpsG family protein [Pediococcus acidilactici]|uniref:EpsG family protein n=1 Tax=Pediococcus acidilactici TaxID=1254 RepID=UPI001BD3EBAA|nr:EpsG family protein [Pediococcus acidilactici]MBS9398427.1 EpsG family protein [Pediococcus acidilactici]
MIYILIALVATAILWIPNTLNYQRRENRLKISTAVLNVVNGISFSIIFLLFSFVAGARYFVGTDFKTYTLHQIPQALYGITKNQYDVEFFYNRLIKLGVAIGGGSYQYVFVLTHVVIMFFICKYIYDRSLNYPLSIFIFVFSTFFNFSLNGMRQSIATAIFLYSTKYIVKRKPAKYFVMILIAILFHKSAIIFVPFFLFSYFDLKKSRRLIIGLFISSPIVLMSLNAIHNIVYRISVKFNFYTKFFGSMYDTGTVSNMNIMLLLANLLITVIVYLIYSEDKKVRLKDGENIANAITVDYNIQVVATIFSLISFAIPGSFRVFYMFMPIQMTLIANVFYLYKNKSMKIALLSGILLMYAIIFFIIIILWNQNETLPYISVFQ